MRDKDKLFELNRSQLEVKLNEFIEEGRNLRFDRVLSTVDNPARIRYVRRSIARIKTLLREYDLGISNWTDEKRERPKNKKKIKK